MRRLPDNAPPIHPLMHVPVPWVFVLAYLVGVGLELLAPLGSHAAGIARPARVGGFVLLAAGGLLAVWCLAIFRGQGTTTVPFAISAKLVTWGPYRLSRNPMYVSLALIYLGEAAVLAQIWPLVTLLPTIAYVNGIVVPYEESRLRQAFGSDYEQYCVRVGRWLIRGR